MNALLLNALISLSLHSTPSNHFDTTSVVKPPVMKLDTVACLFHQVMSDNKPALSWRKGYIVTQNDNILIGSKIYPLESAPTLTGTMTNTFLSNDKKTIVRNRVIQVVVL